LTPGQPSIPGVKRLPIGEATNLTRIPVQPLSYGDARKLLEPLRGPVRPKGFQGGLPFAYHVGGTDDVRVRLNTALDYQIRKIWNVIARVEGQVENDRWVILGNHRDAWTFGAVDPSSGSAAMLEVARGFGQLLKQGWKPRRTILLCSWDGEEYGLLGSTEWVEESAAELKTKAWYKHQIYAPGFYTGYAALPLPDFRQALDDRNETEAREALARVVQALKRATAALKL